MEAKLGGQAQNFYGPMVSDLTGFGKRSLDWDLNDWKWDGDLFTASPLNSVAPDCRFRQLFPAGPETPVDTELLEYPSYESADVDVRNGERKREMEKRRRDIGVENGELQDEAGSLNLKLGGESFPIMDEDGKGGKKSKIVGNSSHRAVCQVDDCRADLSNAKDYHRRHKVCDMHSKASRALVGNVMQRFCQQCSRFHVLQEFDEGKRSCRRRLAGHNRRRRKTHPDNTANGESVNDGHSSSYLLISLLRILSNMHSNSSVQAKDQDLLSHLLKNLASLTGTVTEKNISASLQGSQASLNAGVPSGAEQKVPDINIREPEPEPAMPSGSAFTASDVQNRLRFPGQGAAGPMGIYEQKHICTDTAMVGSPQVLPGLQSDKLCSLGEGSPAKANESDGRIGTNRLSNIDLNSVYDSSQDCVENVGRLPVPVNPTTNTFNFAQHDSQNFSSVQTSRNSDSTSTHSPSSSSGEAQSRTDRIVFKLFGKEPNDFPLVLRTQILDWLSHSPTDIESYIRPGCIILTIYLRLGKQSWEELCSDLGHSLKRLLDASDDSCWKMGWIYTRVQDAVAFIYNGRVVLDTPLSLKNHGSCKISSIKPIAVPLSEKAQFVVKGFNLCHSTTRVLCALEGTYLLQKSLDFLEDADSSNVHNGLQCFSFDCSVPNVCGRGFVEVEDNGLSSSFCPFIVAEQEVCSEICMLEDAIELSENNADNDEEIRGMKLRNQALEFLHEMGWLLHRNHVRFRLGGQDPNLCLFSFNRFRWLMEFSVDHDWCAVVKKLLCILLEGIIDQGEHLSTELALQEMGLLHKAVQRNCRPMVELLLRFSPKKILDEQALERNEHIDSGYSTIFRPDSAGPAGLTPLHLAACTDGSENVLDALTDDPGLVGIQAWRTVRDDMGFTPNDYACLRGHYSYIHLVQRKIKKSEGGHVVVDIPAALVGTTTKPKLSEGHKTAKLTNFQMEKVDVGTIKKQCRICKHKMLYGNRRTSLAYRPAMLSLVAIATVCVCVALLFKSSPELQCLLRPFRWDRLEYGSM